MRHHRPLHLAACKTRVPELLDASGNYDPADLRLVEAQLGKLPKPNPRLECELDYP
jgi:hypothetical protein